MEDTCPETTGTNPGSELASLFRHFGPDYLANHTMAPEQSRALRHIISCRTPVLGGHADVCTHCGKMWKSWNSCRDRHCPVCQGAQQFRWIEARTQRLVPTHHFHVVFTLPEPLRAVALANRRIVYNLLFRAAKDTLLELAQSNWGAMPGITAVLHTWTREMALHPHIHCIVTGGGLTEDGAWVAAKPNFLFPVKVMGALFRGKFLEGLRKAYQKKKLRFVGSSSPLGEPGRFKEMCDGLYSTSWVVYAKRPFGGPKQVLKYLGRYTHRVAISNARLCSVTENLVVFKTKKGAICRLHPTEFIRRFLLHILPKGFRKIRHFGLLAPANVRRRLKLAQEIVGGMNRQDRRSLAVPEVVAAERSVCPSCHIGHLFQMRIPPVRGPP